MKRTIISAISAVVFATTAQSAVIQYSIASLDYPITTSTTTLLPTNNVWKLGTFATLNDAAIISAINNNSYSVLAADFREFTSGTMNNAPGKINVTAVADNAPVSGPAAGFTFTNKPAYVWVLNKSAFPVGPTFDAATEVGMFKPFGEDGATPIVFPASTGLTDPAFNVNFDPYYIPASQVLYGSTTADGNLGTGNYKLGAVVPEPTSFTLVGLVGAMLILRRRRA